nr:hypothetical protein [Lysinibacillus timonensis]
MGLQIKEKGYIDISAGAFIMAMGIFLLGAILQFPLFEQYFADVLSILLIVLWLLMIGSFLYALLKGEYRLQLKLNPIKVFGAGTWIAGTSVLCILISNRLPELMYVFRLVLLLNVVCWLVFIVQCIIQFKKVIQSRSIEKVHGVILLSTVSTQSIACLFINYFENKLIVPLSLFLIGLGFAFYLFSISLIVIRFVHKKRDIHEWKNTDCIIHGALSITGLAMTQSQFFSFEILFVFWITVFSILVFVEMMEVCRAFIRLKDFGFRKGLFTYDISQWSRNFTFGMFYFFTYNLVTLYKDVSLLNHFMYGLGWIVLALLLLECYLFFLSKIKRRLG